MADRGAVAVRTGAAALAGAAVVLGGQVLWTTRRPLPSLEGRDATGPVPGRGDPHAPPIRLVALGDSTLTGPGLADPDSIWLRRSLAGLGLDRPVDLVSLAVGGSRARDVLATVPDALERSPDAVIVAVGSNDAIHGTGHRTFTTTFDAIVTSLLATVPAVGVCNVGDLGNLARVPTPLSSVLHQRSTAISRRIRAVVARHEGAVLIDVTTSNVGFRDRGVFAEDLFHPNEHGHALWAEAARPGLRDLLARAAAPTDDDR